MSYSDREEGEMSDDNAMDVDDTDSKKNVLYKSERTGLIVTHLDNIDAIKLEERGKRFGLNHTGDRSVTQKQIDELYSDFGIEAECERHYLLNTLHLEGVDGLDTAEIFEYLEDYKPVSLEWINNNTCNIFCQDNISAALALLRHSREILDEDLKTVLKNKPHHWREGRPHPKTQLILMRYATNGDMKITTKKLALKSKVIGNSNTIQKNPWADLCKSWGVYDHQEFVARKVDQEFLNIIDNSKVITVKNKQLATRLGKRQINTDPEDSSSDSEWNLKPKTLRMRMHADDEECKRKKQQSTEVKREKEETYAPLSIEVVNSHCGYTPRENTKLSDKFKKNLSGSRQNNVQSRLGKKPSQVMHKAYSSDEEPIDSPLHNLSSRVQKINSNIHKNVWSRLERKLPTDQSDLRQFIKSKIRSKPDDLRDVIKKTKKPKLFIEVDNNLYK